MLPSAQLFCAKEGTNLWHLASENVKKKIRTRGAAAEVFLIQFISVISHFVRCEHCAVVRCYETCHRSSSFSVFYFIFSCSWWRWHSVLLPTPQQLSWLLGFFREFNRKNLINTSALARALWWWRCPQGTLPCCRRIAGWFRLANPADFYIFFVSSRGWLIAKIQSSSWWLHHRRVYRDLLKIMFWRYLPSVSLRTLAGFCHNFLFGGVPFTETDWLRRRRESCQLDRFEWCFFLRVFPADWPCC